MASPSDPAARLLTRIQDAINAHDLEQLTACFAKNYRAELPNHPSRNFVGADQVRRNWAQIFAGVPDIRATLRSATADNGFAWGEWTWAGTRGDGAIFAMAGITILKVEDGEVVSSRFYLEPVESASGNVATDIRRKIGPEAAAR